MTDDKHIEKKKSKRALKWFLIPLLVILFLIGGLRWLVQSNFLMGHLKNFAEREVSKQFHGDLSIGNLSGDLLRGVLLTDLQVTDIQGDIVLTADSIRVGYSVINLIRQPHEVDFLTIDGLHAYGEQYDDGIWNFQALIPEAEVPAVDEEAAEIPHWFLENLRIGNTTLTVRSPELPDEQVTIRDLLLQGSIGYSTVGWEVNVDDFRFLLDETRFIQPAELGAVAQVRGETISIENFMFNTGRTILESHARIDSEENVSGTLEFNPISWLDINSYAEVPLKQDISGRFGFEGSLQNLLLRLEIEADGLESMNLEGRVHLDNELSVSHLRADIKNFNGPVLTGDSLAPVVESIVLTGDGDVLPGRLSESRFGGSLAVTGITADTLSFDQLNVNYNWLDQEVIADLTILNNWHEIHSDIEITGIFDELPDWKIGLQSEGLNLARFLDNPEYESRLNLMAAAEGRGFGLSEEIFSIDLSVYDAIWGEQPFRTLAMQGNLSADEINGLLNFEIEESSIQVEFDASQWQSEPVYSFRSEIREFNLNDLAGLDDFPSNLNANIEGYGAWFDLENLELSALVQFDSSFVNHEPIENIHAAVEIRNQTAYVSDGEVLSPIADIRFSLQQHLLDFRDPDNKFDIDAEIKNLQPLSPIAGVDTLKARGTISSQLYRAESGDLQISSVMKLEEIVYDTLLIVESLEGGADVQLVDEPEVNISLDIKTPSVQGYAIQSVFLGLNANLRDEVVDGMFELDFLQDDENAIHHGAYFESRQNDLLVRTENLVIQTPDRVLSLQNAFDVTMQEGVVRMDTLHIQSPNGTAYLKLAVPYLAEDRQEVILDARLLDLGTLQRSLLDQEYAEALLSGTLDFSREGEDISTDAKLFFSEIRYNNGTIDSLRIDANIQDGRLLASAGAWQGDTELLVVRGDIPFEPGDPLEFDDEFFEQPVEGEIHVPGNSIAFWKQFMDDGAELEADGILSFSSRISGSAGHPVFDGRLSMREGNFSGVAIDSILIDIGYVHEESEIQFKGNINSLGAQIADMEAELPLYVDLRAFSIDLPEDTDEVFVRFNTHEFDLAILNDFLDRDLMRDLRGRLSGNVELSGPIAALEPRGNLQLRRGSLRVIPVGINLGEIQSDLNIDPERIELQSFSMRSGPGRFSASGFVELNQFEPGNVDIRFDANQFRAANTADMNAVLDLNSRLRGSFASPDLSGSLRFRSGFVNLQNFGEQAVEDVQLEDDPDPVEIEFYNSMAVDMNVIFDRQFFIRNRQYLDLEIELAGEIDLVKSAGSDLEMFGSMEGVRGYARPMGRNFELEDAIVTFFGPIGNPELNVRTRYRPPQSDEEITIWYIIEGTVEDPVFRFESEPFLELQDIISYTLFGRPFYALESWQQAVSGGGRGASAADVALDLLLDRFEILAAQQLGIDVVQIDTDRTGSTNSTTIKTGWYLSDRTFFAVLNEISGTSPKTLFMLEYLIRRNLELIVTQGDDSREGIDLRWRFDY
jgi:hypothetical protein